MSWSTKTTPEIAAKRAGGRRHYNMYRHLKQTQRRLTVSQLLFDDLLGMERPLGRLIPWGIQKKIAEKLGVSEGTVSRDIRSMLRAQLYPGLPAAKAAILGDGDRTAIARAVERILKLPGLPERTFLVAAKLIVDMDNCNIMVERNWPKAYIRSFEASICRRAYRLFLETLTKAEKREWFQEQHRARRETHDFDVDLDE